MFRQQRQKEYNRVTNLWFRRAPSLLPRASPRSRHQETHKARECREGKNRPESAFISSFPFTPLSTFCLLSASFV